MKPQFRVFEPVETTDITIRPDVVGFYPFTLNGNFENSNRRLQAAATAAGIPIIAAEVLGQDTKLLYNRPVDQALKPGRNFMYTSQWNADAVNTRLADYHTRIGIGHSLGGVVVSGMQIYGEQPPFSAIELCDAFNLQAPQSSPHAYVKYMSYQAIEAVRSYKNPSGPFSIDPTSPGLSPRAMLRNIHNVSRLMRSEQSRDSTVRLANDPALPLHVVGFDHGICASGKHVQQFLIELLQLRQKAGSYQPGGTHAPLLATYRRGWHSDLLDPQKIAQNLRLTISIV